jgi:predicted anti-sigma-YlaC factor YlaD
MADHETKLDCEAVLKHLFERLDCELDPAKSVEVDRHLADCRACFSRAEFERKLLVVEDFDRKS